SQPHAGPDAAARHEGERGNVEADASGNAKLDYVDHQISLGNDAKSAIGRSVVVHAKPDDLKTQPSGDAGGRVGRGGIRWGETQGRVGAPPSGGGCVDARGLPRERGTPNVARNLFARQSRFHLIKLPKTIALHAYATTN